MERLIRNEVARCQPPGLRKETLSRILLHVFFLHFSQQGFESVRRKFLSGNIAKQKVVLLVIYLFNYHSSTLSCAQFLSNNLEFIAIQRLQEHSSFLSLCVLIQSTSAISKFQGSSEKVRESKNSKNKKKKIILHT